MKVIILAGGIGTRLWPESRQARPKQLQTLVSDRSLLQETVDRVLPMAAAGDIYVVTGRQYAAAVARQLPEIPRANIIGEPVGRGSAPAIGLAATYLQHSADDLLAFLPADHFIAWPERFRQILAAAGEAALGGYLVTLGIQPTSPSTGYGYIQRGERVAGTGESAAFRVARFAEKPDLATATAYLQSGQYTWNAGMFVGRAGTFLDEIAAHLPDLARKLASIGEAAGTRRAKRVLDDVWPLIAPVTIDYGVMEKTARAAVIPAEIGWSDVGDWASLASVLTANSQGNVVRGLHAGIDTKRCLIRTSGGKVVATVGLENLVIVDTPDALFICPIDRSQEVKAVVDRLRVSGLIKYL